MSKAPRPTLDHPAFASVKARFPGSRLRATEFRGQSTLIVEPSELHAVLTFLKSEPSLEYVFLSDVTAVDYLRYPTAMPGRFAVVYILRSFARDDVFVVKTYLDPSLPTEGIDPDPALVVDSVTDIWPGAEWREREVFDMFGIRFRNHPDLRRILTWETYPAHPLRKDYPLRGRGERESYRVVDRSSA
ncbi:MAG: NADH-quinone oxidoreductase subunit C [Phycisphaeraceae bacterium]|nr:NADH-quinone oxidoreductase subunit C [Phycisphaeraceae bacterium]MCW5754090.1 NADH-quinone oxidoreductase subunit C [Phycisphaeraceae bacterium]